MQPMHQIPARGALNYDDAPFLAIWEVTQSCDLACKHCRAAAQPLAHPDQLTTEEAKALIDQIADAETRTHGWATRRVNDGKGFLFVSHTGNVYPSGFLPIHAGNIRQQPLADIYRNAPIFKALRDTGRLQGKCGACEYKEICGGSRARAYALTGDPLAQEPCCTYQPKNWRPVADTEMSRPERSEFANLLVTL